jgi:BirA family biotin operon repressor/biotin-[acetyl-CoA-carboxylase] ligase
LNKYQAPTRFVGKNTKYHETCASTNSLGFHEALEYQLPEGFAWIAGHQTAGKGQRGNQWLAQPNENLLVSYLLKPHNQQAINQFYLSKAISIGILEGLQKWAKNTLLEALPIKIKWPNDLYLEEQKIAGILIENNFQAGKWNFSIVGIGININQTEFENLRASSLKKWTQSPIKIDIRDIFNAISVEIEHYYQLFQSNNFEVIDQVYHQNLFRIESKALFEDGTGVFSGKILRVNANGHLVLEKSNEIKVYDLKELSFIFSE